MMSMEIELISWFQAKAYEVVEIPYIQRVSLLSNMLVLMPIDNPSLFITPPLCLQTAGRALMFKCAPNHLLL